MRLINIMTVALLRVKLFVCRVFKIRRRNVLTRDNRLRLRYVCFSFLAVGALLSVFLGQSGISVAYAPYASEREVASIGGEYYDDLEYSEDSDVVIGRSADDPRQQVVVLLPEDQEEYEEGFSVAAPSDGVPDTALPVEVAPFDLETETEIDTAHARLHKEPVSEAEMLPRDEILEVSTGDTVAGVLQNAGVSGAEAFRVVKAMGKKFDPRSVKAGQIISVSLDRGDDGLAVDSFSMKISPTKELHITKDEYARFSADVKEKEIVKHLKAAQVSIETSLYGSAARVGIPASMVAEMIRIYSYEVDFQRDIRKGDTVEILYEVYETEDGDFARYGNVLFANLTVNKTRIPIYRFDRGEGFVEYYHENGRSLRRTLMQTPIDGARISSGYGMRRHPVLGYNKMHKGIDFAAPRGTPIYAAGDGVIKKAGRHGGYGNYVRISHINNLDTAYAHLHKFAKGIRSGVRVKQGQVIGYVGSTGRSTGPHLHFEVLKNNRQINPKSVKTSKRAKLSGKTLQNFQSQMNVIKDKYVRLSKDLKFARNATSQ